MTNGSPCSNHFWHNSSRFVRNIQRILYVPQRSLNDTQFYHYNLTKVTSSSAIAEGPRDALSQLKSCQLLANCTNKKASIRWQDSAPPISGYWPTSEPNAGDHEVHDIPLTGSNSGNLTAFRAIFIHIFTAQAQERPFMNFRLKFWYHHSIPWSRFPYRARYFGDTRTFSVDFCTG